MAGAPSAPGLTIRYLSDSDAPQLGVRHDRTLVYFTVDVPGRVLYPYVPQSSDDHGQGRGVYFGEEDFLSAAPILKFLLNLTSHPERADVDAIDRLMDEVAPDVALMIDSMVVGPGGSPDWSVTSRQIAEELTHRLDRWPYRGTEYDFPHKPRWTIDAEELFVRHPHLIKPEWKEMDSEQLDREARFTLLAAQRLPEYAGSDGHGRVRVVGVRTWIYSYREGTGNENGLRPVDAAAWPGIVAFRIAVRDDSTEAELEQVAKDASAAAEAEGVRLIAPGRLMAKLREQRRDDVRAQLKAEGESIAQLEKELRPARIRRRALVARVLSWGVATDTDTAVGMQASMSHTAVGGIRASLNDEDQDEPAEEVSQ